jgi:hypothetical protein
MKLRLLFFIGIFALGLSVGRIWGYYEGDKHALDTMRLIGCQNPDTESFQMRELPPERGDPL